LETRKLITKILYKSTSLSGTRWWRRYHYDGAGKSPCFTTQPTMREKERERPWVVATCENHSPEQ
jgi:hypothetical protein